MTKQEILKNIIDCVSVFTVIPKEDICEKSHLTKDLFLDSLTLMSFMCVLEEKFKISLNEDCFLIVPTIGKIGKYISKRLQENA